MQTYTSTTPTYTDSGHLFVHQLDLAQREDWRRDFQSCMQNLHKHYSYTHVHDVTSIAAILVEVAGADAVCNLTMAPTSIPERTKAVNSFVSSILRSAEEYETDEDTATEQASAEPLTANPPPTRAAPVARPTAKIHVTTAAAAGEDVTIAVTAEGGDVTTETATS